MRRLLIYSLCALPALFMSCEKKELVSHYERPEWLKGNAWEVLEERGNFTLFLEAAERAGFRDVLDGKTIATVFAPTDSAFTNYLESLNATSVAQLPVRELKKLIGYHLVYYAYDTPKLVDYQPNGIEGVELRRAGLYYKHRTRSQDTITVEVDKSDGKAKAVYHKERFLPVFSATHFQTKGIDAASNYEYFFGPDSWKGDSGFNVGNAGVTEYEIRTDNGYVYAIDNVLIPLNTVYETLESNEDYWDFLDIYDRFRSYTYDEETSTNYAAVGDSLYSVNHGILPSIASEWTTVDFEGISFFDLAGLSHNAYNIFAPSNQALETFFGNYFAGYYRSLQDVDMLPLAMLMVNHVYQGNVVFPGEIGTNPDVESLFGTPIQFDPNADVKVKALGSNGAFYGLDNVLVPDLFSSVSGPAFRNPKYRMFMYMLFNSGLYDILSSHDIDYTLFIPSDEVLLNTLYGDSYFFWNEGNPLVFGDEAVEVQNSDGILVPLSSGAQTNFVSDHIIYGNITDMQGPAVYRTRNSFSYVFVKDGEFYSTTAYNSDEGSIPVTDIGNDAYNGSSYETGVAVFNESRSIKFTLIGAETPSSPLNNYAEFSKLLARAGLLETDSPLPFLFGNRFLLFAPDNATVLRGIADGTIPSDNEELAEYLKSYFVSVPDNSLSDYPFPGFGVQGTWNTTLLTGYNEFRQIRMVDNGTDLELIDKDNTSIPIVDYLPQVFSDGAVYHIDQLLAK